jgi:hypothetical protein
MRVKIISISSASFELDTLRLHSHLQLGLSILEKKVDI